jgi:RimJ/RimL family protein N-acetyltransferase
LIDARGGGKMIAELSKANYDMVRPLFRALEYHLSSAAVLDGNNPGKVFVDDRFNPQTAFMVSPEGCYLAGDPDNHAFNQTLNHALFGGEVFDWPVRELVFICHPEGWQERLATVLAPRQTVAIPRRHYVCRRVRYDWQANVPEGFAVRRIDAPLLDRPGLTIPSHVTDWAENNWGSLANFLHNGFGFATVHGDEMVSWSLTDCRSGDACEIGIHTAEAFRRRGLAAITAAATAGFALSHGFATVGWQCNLDNLGSIGTAEKVGFEKERDYTMRYVLPEEAQ